MKKLKLFAIYKNGEHKGNEKGFSIEDAIKKYLIASSFATLLNDIGFISQYSGYLAVENVHFTNAIFDEDSISKVQKKRRMFFKQDN
jgi:hypothetical protein